VALCGVAHYESRIALEKAPLGVISASMSQWKGHQAIALVPPIVSLLLFYLFSLGYFSCSFNIYEWWGFT